MTSPFENFWLHRLQKKISTSRSAATKITNKTEQQHLQVPINFLQQFHRKLFFGFDSFLKSTINVFASFSFSSYLSIVLLQNFLGMTINMTLSNMSGESSYKKNYLMLSRFMSKKFYHPPIPTKILYLFILQIKCDKQIKILILNMNKNIC